jgi:protein gp37
MAKETGISWTDATWNAWQGCHRISEGCAFCYMFRDKARYGKDPEVIVRSKDGTFNRPLNWKEPLLIFTNSWSDVFIEEAEQWLDEFWATIRKCPQHTFQILTKRIDRVMKSLPPDWGRGYENVWLGVSVENQKRADERIPVLLDIPAKVRFLSCEPLLSDLDLTNYLYNRYHMGGARNMYNQVDWVIVGGESGFGNKPKDPTVKFGYRECKLEWIQNIVGQCKQADVPVFVKQFGSHLSKTMNLIDKTGADINEFPEHLRFQEFPKYYTKKIAVV